MSKFTRKKFSKEEDEIIVKIYSSKNPPDWETFSILLPDRTERRCKERYFNYLDPCLSKKEWTKEEDKLLKKKVLEIGFKWVKIKPFFEGRSASNIKNRWYRHIIKKFDKKYIDEYIIKQNYQKRFQPYSESINLIQSIFKPFEEKFEIFDDKKFEIPILEFFDL